MDTIHVIAVILIVAGLSICSYGLAVGFYGQRHRKHDHGDDERAEDWEGSQNNHSSVSC